MFTGESGGSSVGRVIQGRGVRVGVKGRVREEDDGSPFGSNPGGGRKFNWE